MRRAARALAVGAAVAGAALATASCGGGPSARPPATGGATALEGRRLFVRTGCGTCHALATVQARGASGPDFDTSERLDRAQLRESLTEGANGMPSYAGRLTARQMDAITEFLYAATHGRRPARPAG